jgi:hypothetical protein
MNFIVDPYIDKHLMATYMGTRLLQATFDLVGAQIRDPFRSSRLWTLQAFYAPVRGRALGGVRARLTDQKNFVTFVNQRDLEVLLGIAEPGTWCQWARQEYEPVDSSGWYGFAMDDDDLEDDLHDREMVLRVGSPDGFLMEGELHRRVHLDEDFDAEEYFILIWDADPETGMSPDMRLETVERRWKRVERTRNRWEHIR